jgi:hypothetical protein
MDLSVFNAVLTIGGDGLLFEIVNGIATREDGETILRVLKFTPIPGGTGNGLIKSILFECHEEYSALHATFVALKGVSSHMEIKKVTTIDGKLHHAFLILGWGLISDIDILSESMRCLGESRMYIAAVYLMLRKWRYRGRLQMKLVGDGGGRVNSSLDSLSSIDIGVSSVTAGNGSGAVNAGAADIGVSSISTCSAAAAAVAVSELHRSYTSDKPGGSQSSTPGFNSASDNISNISSGEGSNGTGNFKPSDVDLEVSFARQRSSEMRPSQNTSAYDTVSMSTDRDTKNGWLTIETSFVLVWVLQHAFRSWWGPLK